MMKGSSQSLWPKKKVLHQEFSTMEKNQWLQFHSRGRHNLEHLNTLCLILLCCHHLHLHPLFIPIIPLLVPRRRGGATTHQRGSMMSFQLFG
ncbi:hypothetical protein Ahy_A10g050117 isoform E [Arachis hypogaea]|uniref:Uncharacterized protein n=1 Tax=Arachis hypogaea TaxID=3818 RepID=A0A445B8M4_ARAHY|nr:hypothetical protein Ahy_A10g050117 isoform E [Arachis hypogaea]